MSQETEQKALVPIPPEIELLYEMDGITLRRKWWSVGALFLLFFCIFWDGFMIVWFGIALTQGHWEMALFGTLHGAVGVGLTYYMVACFINKTDIRITPSTLSVRHYPLRWPGNKEIDTTDIKQLYCKEKISRNRNSNSISYELHLIDLQGKQHKLLAGLTSSEQVHYLEQEIESVLGIKQQAVSGELSR